tara:strand:- start:46 stop:492 length:447 start_codon:yes stop_codon:yes gene_type:complete
MDKQEQERQEALATLNPTNITEQLKDLENAVLGGWISGLDASLAVKKFESLLGSLKKNIQESAITEARSFPNGYASSLGKVELRSTATRYSYKHIPEWNEKKSELDAIEQKAKLVAKSGVVLFSEEGVQIEPAISSGGSESIFITLRK